jgi:hypothetical protein
MRLNAPNVRHVIHYKPPTSLETYFLSDDEPLVVDLEQRKSNRKNVETTHTSSCYMPFPITLHHKALNITGEKKHDLMDLVRTGIIPRECQLFYASLPT